MDSHSDVRVDHPRGWRFYVSHDDTVNRLVVFVHGFKGHAVDTWNNFLAAGDYREWWSHADLLFVGYESLIDNITGVAHRLRRELPTFYPHPYEPAMLVTGGPPPRTRVEPYEELFLVGHSLGGLIIRRALCDLAAQRDDPNNASEEGPPRLLDAQMRLFSPASAGFRAAGWLGLAEAIGGLRAIGPYLRRSSAYTDLQPNSTTLVETRERTERLVEKGGFEVLRARIVWANPDNVVVAERYSTDWVDTAWDETTHMSVCKPHVRTFERPWDFVETGRG